MAHVIRRPKAVKFADELEADIRAGRFAPGAEIPTVRALAVAWGTSVQSAQNVVDILRSRGLVETSPPRRTVVADPLPPPASPAPSLEERVARLEAEVAEIRDRL